MENIKIRGNFSVFLSHLHPSLLSLFKNVTQMSLGPEILWNQIRLSGISNPMPFRNLRLSYNHLFLLCLLHTVLVQKFTPFPVFPQTSTQNNIREDWVMFNMGHMMGLWAVSNWMYRCVPALQMPFSFSSHPSFLPTCSWALCSPTFL